MGFAMENLRKDGVYQIRVTNTKDKSVWDHKRVPYDHVECLKMSPNLDVTVVRMVSTDDPQRRVHRNTGRGA